MKTAILFAIIAGVVPVASFAQSLAERVTPAARPQIRTTYKKISGSSARVHHQSVSLLISLSGRPKSPETRTVKWYFFGRDLKSNRVTVLESGEEKLALGGFGRQTMETKSSNSTYTPNHSVVEHTRGRKGERQTRVKRVDGSGVKYIGYGVEVKEGETVVGKIFMNPGLEAEVR